MTSWYDSDKLLLIVSYYVIENRSCDINALQEYLQRERYGSARLDNFASGLELIRQKVLTSNACICHVECYHCISFIIIFVSYQMDDKVNYVHKLF